MSILIKGISMPNKKSGAVLIIYPDGKCAVEDGAILQAVELSPHGRLIDADALCEQWAVTMENGRPMSNLFDGDCVFDIISEAQTIIEAEEGEA